MSHLEGFILPFLKHKQQSVAGLIIKRRAPDQPEDSQDQPSAHAMECAKSILAAIEAKDEKGLAKALEMFQSGKSEEKEESNGGFDDQNKLAAKAE